MINVIKKYILKIYDRLLYFYCKLSGQNYSAYYAMRMDFIVSRNPDWGLNLERKSQLDYLIAKGLKPDSNFLDYGCGAISAGRFFINYLDKKKYSGVDISSKVIDEAKKRISRFNLDKKAPNLFYAKDGSMNGFNFQIFDYIWAQSVITHMPPESVNDMFQQLKKYMNPQSKFLFTFTKINQKITHTDYKDWAYSIKAIEEIAKNNGFFISIQEDWIHEVDNDILSGIDTVAMAQITTNDKS